MQKSIFDRQSPLKELQTIETVGFKTNLKWKKKDGINEILRINNVVFEIKLWKCFKYTRIS